MHTALGSLPQGRDAMAAIEATPANGRDPLARQPRPWGWITAVSLEIWIRPNVDQP